MAKINLLSDKAIATAKPKEKPYMLADGGLLYLLVTPAGGKLWRLKYRFGGAQKTIALQKALGASSAYPAISLKDARQLRDEAKKLLAAGINPAEARRQEKTAKQAEAANSFRNVTEEWFSVWQAGKTASTIKHMRSRLDRFILPVLGDKPVADIAGPDVLEVLRPIEAKGQLDTTHRVKVDVSLILQYAIATGKRALADPCPYLNKVLQTPVVKHHAAFTRPEQVGELIRAIDGYRGQSVFVRAALRLLPLFFCRPGELRTMRWEDVDLEAAEWSYISSKKKVPHIVPLARQAVAILQELRNSYPSGEYVFPGARSDKRPISDMTINRALQALGYDTKTEITGHGFRALARTLLSEKLKPPPEFIERQLSHKTKAANGTAYDRAQFLEDRRPMMQAWATFIDSLREGLNAK